MEPLEKIRKNLKQIYPEPLAETTFRQIVQKLDAYRLQDDSSDRYAFTQKDVVLITYADQFRMAGRPALKGLHEFAGAYLEGIFNSIHLLPFFPYSSDDGFSVVDYYQVDPDLGNWDDIQALSHCFRLMVDGVFNHISRQSRWFQAFLAGEAPYDRFFISVPPQTDLSAVVRPRTSPLLSKFRTKAGERYVWTTFSDDQIDLNFANPRVLLEIVDVLFFYIRQGARIIRLDAVPFLWKEIGTDCIHRPQTHALIKTLRALLDEAAPGVVLITESNVPFKENIAYLGQIDPQTGLADEAQLVYQFSLGPLVLHALISGEARILSDWVSRLPAPYNYFNFIASHDGIGLLPAQGILSPRDIDLLIQRTEAHDGLLSYKIDTDGQRQVYELNITLYDFLNDPHSPRPELDLPRYLTSQIIMLELGGVPGVYVHSLFGSHNCMDCYRETGRSRSINREKFSLEKLQAELSANSHAGQLLRRYLDLVALRVAHAAFSPAADQSVLNLHAHVFALLRHDPRTGERILCLSNLTAGKLALEMGLANFGLSSNLVSWQDLITGYSCPVENNHLTIELSPYQSLWLLAA